MKYNMHKNVAKNHNKFVKMLMCLECMNENSTIIYYTQAYWQKNVTIWVFFYIQQTQSADLLNNISDIPKRQREKNTEW